jgi:hypothetical protein
MHFSVLILIHQANLQYIVTYHVPYATVGTSHSAKQEIEDLTRQVASLSAELDHLRASIRDPPLSHRDPYLSSRDHRTSTRDPCPTPRNRRQNSSSPSRTS